MENTEKMVFKTTINCGGCLARVTPKLDSVEGIGKWEVNLQDTRRMLSVEPGTATEAEITAAVESAGFKAERMN